MRDQTNSEEAELKRERTSLRGKIDRRLTTISFMQSETRRYRERLWVIEEKLVEYKPLRGRKAPHNPAEGQADD